MLIFLGAAFIDSDEEFLRLLEESVNFVIYIFPRISHLLVNFFLQDIITKERSTTTEWELFKAIRPLNYEWSGQQRRVKLRFVEVL